MSSRPSIATAIYCCGVLGLAGWRPSIGCHAGEGPSQSAAKSAEKIVPIKKTDAQWKRLLTRRQFEVTRRGHTEPAFSGKTWNNKLPGTYRCVCCGLVLFTSETKFESQTGWPSFWRPAFEHHVHFGEDRSELPPRVEVLCARCDAHLGHVFSDGPPPTGLRFCMNSAALKFSEDTRRSH